MKDTRASDRLRSEGDLQGLYSSENNRIQPCFPAICASSFLRAVTRDRLSQETVCNVQAPASLPIDLCGFSSHSPVTGASSLGCRPTHCQNQSFGVYCPPMHSTLGYRKKNEVTEVNTLSFCFQYFKRICTGVMYSTGAILQLIGLDSWVTGQETLAVFHAAACALRLNWLTT